MNIMNKIHNIPEWLFEFNGYRCPFLIIGYRMGKLAIEKLNLTKENSYEMFVFSELGIKVLKK